jgi:alpha-1,3-rhamnosyl/mannosyltransferase
MTRHPRVAIYCLDQDPATTSSLGIYHYTQRLVQCLATFGPWDLEFVLWVTEGSADSIVPPDRPAWLKVHRLRGVYATGTRRLAADHLLAPLLALRHRINLVHYPKGWMPLISSPRVRSVASLHDTIIHDYRSRYRGVLPHAKVLYFDWNTRHTLKHADLVITGTACSKRDLAALVPAAEAKIRVTGDPPPPVIHSAASAREGLLVMGSILPHKATAQTLRLLDRHAGRTATRHVVTVTGLSGWPDTWGRRPSQIELRFAGRLGDSEMERHLRRTRALVFLSEHEGFGLPLLEAYAAGTPVCYRNSHALAEVMQNAPGGWNGRDEASFLDALDTVLQMSAADVTRGRDALLSRYSGRAVAEKTVRVYREALRQPL